MQICFNALIQGYDDLKNRYLFLFMGMVFTCGRANALPQDWPCAEIDLNIVANGNEWGHKFQGNNGLFEVTINNFDETEDQPYIYNCGNSGCLGTIKNLKTGKYEAMRFDCLYNAQQKSLRCRRIDGDEYLLTKVSENKYQVQLCNNYYKSLNINQCSGCKCTLQDSRGKQAASDLMMNCLKENANTLRCFSYNGYEKWRNFENKDEDFENCVGLNL